MRKIRNLGVALSTVVIIAGGFALIVLIVITGEDCSGTCASVACTEAAPCMVAGKPYTAGSVCASGVYGSVCKSHWWPFKDCLCTDVIGPGGLPRPSCVQ